MIRITHRWGWWLSHAWQPWVIVAYVALAAVYAVGAHSDRAQIGANCHTNLRLAELQARLATASLFNRELLARYLRDPDARKAFRVTLPAARARLTLARATIRMIHC